MEVDQVRRRRYPLRFLKYALRRALERPSPDTIPMGPFSRLSDRNYTTTYIDGSTDQRYWLVDRIQASRVELRDLETPGDPKGGIVDVGSLRRANFRVVVYFKHLEWQFNSLYRYALFSVFGTPPLRVALDNLLQGMANRASLPTLERTHALQIAVDRASSGNRTLTLLHLLPISGRQHRHPDVETAYKHHQYVLESLEATGELKKKDSGYYEIMPKALVTLDQYRSEERRINAQTHAAFWTALGAAVVGAIVAAYLTINK